MFEGGVRAQPVKMSAVPTSMSPPSQYLSPLLPLLLLLSCRWNGGKTTSVLPFVLLLLSDSLLLTLAVRAPLMHMNKTLITHTHIKHGVKHVTLIFPLWYTLRFSILRTNPISRLVLTSPAQQSRYGHCYDDLLLASSLFPPHLHPYHLHAPP